MQRWLRPAAARASFSSRPWPGELLYDQGFTISGARNRLADGAATAEPPLATAAAAARKRAVAVASVPLPTEPALPVDEGETDPASFDPTRLRGELLLIRDLLSV